MFDNGSTVFTPDRVCTRVRHIKLCVKRTSALARAPPQPTQMRKSAALPPEKRPETRRSAMGRVRPRAHQVASPRVLLARLRRVTLQLVPLRPLLSSRPGIGVGSARVITRRQFARSTKFCSHMRSLSQETRLPCAQLAVWLRVRTPSLWRDAWYTQKCAQRWSLLVSRTCR